MEVRDPITIDRVPDELKMTCETPPVIWAGTRFGDADIAHAIAKMAIALETCSLRHQAVLKILESG